MKTYFYVELDKPASRLQVYEWPEADLKKHMKEEGVRNPLDLEDYDCRVFDSEKKAEVFLKQYKEILNSLTNKRLCKSRDLPAILYKRRYMVLSLMGLKPQTYRGYKKNWKTGQLFNLHDQTFFLTVRLSSLTYEKSTGYCYKFKVVGKR